jgi:hypothetical protein
MNSIAEIFSLCTDSKINSSKKATFSLICNDLAISCLKKISDDSNISLEITKAGLISELTSLTPTGEAIEVVLLSLKKESLGAYNNWQDLIHRNITNISKGEKFQFNHIIDSSTKEDDVDKTFKKLNTIIEINKSLNHLAKYHDNKQGKYTKHIFITHNESNTLASEVEIYCDIDLVDKAPLESSQLSFIYQDTNDERTAILTATIIEFCKDDNPKINYINLITKFDSLIELFNKNHEVYLNKFKFADLKLKITKEYLEYIQKIDDISSNISSKVLSIPISIAAISAVITINNVYSTALIVLSALLLTVITSLSLDDKRRSLKDAFSTQHMILHNADDLPEDISKLVKPHIDELDSYKDSLLSRIYWFKIITYLIPTLGMIIWFNSFTIIEYYSYCIDLILKHLHCW